MCVWLSRVSASKSVREKSPHGTPLWSGLSVSQQRMDEDWREQMRPILIAGVDPCDGPVPRVFQTRRGGAIAGAGHLTMGTSVFPTVAWCLRDTRGTSSYVCLRGSLPRRLPCPGFIRDPTRRARHRVVAKVGGRQLSPRPANERERNGRTRKESKEKRWCDEAESGDPQRATAGKNNQFQTHVNNGFGRPRTAAADPASLGVAGPIVRHNIRNYFRVTNIIRRRPGDTSARLLGAYAPPPARGAAASD